MCLLHSLVVRLLKNIVMDPDTFKLIQKLCNELRLAPEIEFTCYEAYEEYFRRYFTNLNARIKQTTLKYSSDMKYTSHLIGEALNDVEKSSLLHTLTLVSVCAKYVNGHRCDTMFRHLPKYLQLNGTPYSTEEIRETEYIVFKFLGFNIKPSKLYSAVFRLVTKISERNARDDIQFNCLHDECLALIRLFYLHRKMFDEIFYNVDTSVYGSKGNDVQKLGAATVLAATMNIYPQCGDTVLNEIVRCTYLNESFLRKMGQSIQKLSIDCK